jgi:hypothetical protein
MLGFSNTRLGTHNHSPQSAVTKMFGWPDDAPLVLDHATRKRWTYAAI